MSYKQFITAARDRLTSSSRDSLQIPGRGIVEYISDGSGRPALVSHPLFGGFDVGLGVGRKFLGPDFRVIAPSRFGYLGSTLPTAALPADQADAFAAVLDTLDLEGVAVLGYSAGGPPAIQFALRHPDRVSALVLVASALPGEAGSPPKPVANLLFGSDLVFWLLGRSGSTLTARILGMDAPASGPEGHSGKRSRTPGQACSPSPHASAGCSTTSTSPTQTCRATRSRRQASRP